MRALDVRSVAVEIEDYQPVRVYMHDGSAIAFVHGLETWEYRQGPPTLSELFVRFDLRRAESGWSIERTDEWKIGEPMPSEAREADRSP